MTNKTEPRTLVVIPTYNERENLTVLVQAIMVHPFFESLVVDDQSPDGTGDVADGLARECCGRVEGPIEPARKVLGAPTSKP